MAKLTSTDVYGVLTAHSNVIVKGDITVSGIANINVGNISLTSPTIVTSLLTSSTTFSLINTVATTVNFAGTATVINIGASSSGTVTINQTSASTSINTGALVVKGGIGVNGTVYTTNLAVNNTIQSQNITTPSAPASGYNYIYTKSDNSPYVMRSNGNETPLITQTKNGFTNQYNDNTLSFVNATRTLTITPTATTFQVYIGGLVFNKTTESIVIANTEGNHYVYYNSSGVLTDLVNPTGAQAYSLILNNTFVSYIYWDATNALGLIVAKEQHGIIMDNQDHVYDHIYFRTQWNSGLAPNTISSDASGNVNSSAQFGIDTGIIQDEDLQHTISAVNSTTGLPIFYNSGASPSLRSGTQAGYSVLNTGSGRIAYNNINAGGAGIWGLSEVSNGDYILYHIFATNSIVNPLVSVMGQAIYTTIGLAQAGASVELNTIITSFPAPEFKPLATFIFQSSNAYGNAVQARIRAVSTGVDFIDWRPAKTAPGSVVGSSYVLPIATLNTLGGIIADGNTVKASPTGVLSLTGSNTNYISNGLFEVNTNGWALYNDGASSVPIDGTAGTPTAGFTLTQTSVSPLFGFSSGLLTKPASNCQGQGVSFNFTIDSGAVGQPLSISFSYQTNSIDNDIGVYIYDVTNSTLMYPSQVNLVSANNSITSYLGTFLPSTSTSYRLIIHTQTTNATGWTIKIDNISVSLQKSVISSAINNWQTYTATIGATTTPPTLGTNTQYSRWRRVGNQMEIEMTITQTTIGTAGTGTYLFPIPAGYTIDTSQLALDDASTINGSIIGNAWIYQGGSPSYEGNGEVSPYSSTQVLVRCLIESSTPAAIATNYVSATVLNVGGNAQWRAKLKFSVPIAQWQSNINLASDYTEYASNSSSTDANDTTSFAYGSGGSAGVIGTTSLTADRSKRVRFTKPIQNTDTLIIEIYHPSAGMWSTSALLSAGYAIITNYCYISGNGGMSITQVNNTDIDVTFFRYPYGNTSTNWNGAGYANVKWRIKKISNGNMAEVPNVVRADYTGAGVIVPSASPQALPMTTKVEDTHNAVTNPASVGTFTTPIAGVYLIEVSTTTSVASTAIVVFYYQLYKNGSTFKNIAIKGLSANVGGGDIVGSSTIRLVAGDYISIYCTAVNNASGNINTERICITRLGN